MTSIPEAVMGGLTPHMLMDQAYICVENLWPLSILGVAPWRLWSAQGEPSEGL